jgi:hypothetical protein
VEVGADVDVGADAGALVEGAVGAVLEGAQADAVRTTPASAAIRVMRFCNGHCFRSE